MSGFAGCHSFGVVDVDVDVVDGSIVVVVVVAEFGVWVGHRYFVVPAGVDVVDYCRSSELET